jgi:hypothetical protein
MNENDGIVIGRLADRLRATYWEQGEGVLWVEGLSPEDLGQGDAGSRPHASSSNDAWQHEAFSALPNPEDQAIAITCLSTLKECNAMELKGGATCLNLRRGV